MKQIVLKHKIKLFAASLGQPYFYKKRSLQTLSWPNAIIVCKMMSFLHALDMHNAH